MSDKPFNFKEQLAIGKQGEDFLDAYFSTGYRITPATDKEQRLGIDRHFVNLATEAAFTVEYKTDSMAQKTHNAFVETMSVDAKGRSGWAYTSTADWLIYYIPGDELIYVMRFETLRNHIAGWAISYPTRAAMNEGYRTWGICVPLHEFERFAEKVYSV